MRNIQRPTLNVQRSTEPGPLANATCLLCRAVAPFLTLAGKRPFYQCPTCGLIFVPAAWHVSVDAERERYCLHRNSPTDAGYVRFLSPAIEALGRSVPPEGASSVLDYGCGPEPVLVGLLRERGYRVNGYDPFFAPEQPYGALFDAVVSTEAIEHFRVPGVDLQRMTDLVRPGGVVVIMTALTDGVADVGRWHYALDSTHIALYALRTFEWLGARWPLSVIETNGRNLVVLKRVRADACLQPK